MITNDEQTLGSRIARTRNLSFPDGRSRFGRPWAGDGNWKRGTRSLKKENHCGWGLAKERVSTLADVENLESQIQIQAAQKIMNVKCGNKLMN